MVLCVQEEALVHGVVCTGGSSSAWAVCTGGSGHVVHAVCRK